jgi:Stage II sporulation protein E (SpoIIE)/GAF domain
VNTPPTPPVSSERQPLDGLPGEFSGPAPAYGSTRLPPGVGQILHEFRDSFGLDASLWVHERGGWEIASTTAAAPESTLPDDAVRIDVPGEIETAVHVKGGVASRPHARFLAGAIARTLAHEAESRFFGREIAERYEEITLLYSISEILGSVITLEHAACTILQEVAGTLAVDRAALWLHNPEKNRLDLIGAVGVPGQGGPIDVEDPFSITAAAFRDRRPINLEAGEEAPREGGAPELQSRGSLLSVPVSYSPPEGDVRTIGVINLIGRSGGHHFSAGDQKLIMAIASQVGAAVENSRLVEASLRQERMVREMELAHDLQLKLLPSVEQFEGYAEVAARCVPAQSVGGDFYHLFRLPGGRLGVMIGDVSSHGFGAALIMALTMSAVAIHASEGDSPSEVLRRTHQTLIDELETTEMFLTLFYGVIDPRLGELTYANAGHAQAFQVYGNGESDRLPATNPPLGIVDLDAYGETTTSWTAGQDLHRWTLRPSRPRRGRRAAANPGGGRGKPLATCRRCAGQALLPAERRVRDTVRRPDGGPREALRPAWPAPGATPAPTASSRTAPSGLSARTSSSTPTSSGGSWRRSSRVRKTRSWKSVRVAVR